MPPELSQRFKARVESLFKSQQNRASEKKDKNGRIIRKGYALSFDRREFIAWFLDEFGGENTAILCRYCHRPIDAYSCVVDHGVPLKRGGPAELSNLDVICSPCNSVKGKLTPDEMTAFLLKMREMADQFHNAAAVQDITHRLESYSAMKATVNAGRARKQAQQVAAVVTGLNDDDF